MIDDEMSSQGSCYFLKRKFWETIGPLDTEHYGVFAQEFQEIGMRAWLSGGRVVVNKHTWYSHWHKGKEGRGYQFTNKQWDKFTGDNLKAHKFTVDFWLNDRWTKARRPFSWLIEHFAPVPSWPENWKEVLQGFQQGRIEYAEKPNPRTQTN